MKLHLLIYGLLSVCHKEISKHNVSFIALGTELGNIKAGNIARTTVHFIC